MSQDMVKTLFTYGIITFVLVAGYYALVPYPFQLDDLVKGGILGMMSACLAWVLGDQSSSRTAARQQRAFDAGLNATPNMQLPTMTATGGPTPTATLTPSEPEPEPEDAGVT